MNTDPKALSAEQEAEIRRTMLLNEVTRLHGENADLRAQLAPSPCGVDGHLAMHWKLSDSGYQDPTLDGGCFLCTALAARRETNNRISNAMEEKEKCPRCDSTKRWIRNPIGDRGANEIPCSNDVWHHSILTDVERGELIQAICFCEEINGYYCGHLDVVSKIERICATRETRLLKDLRERAFNGGVEYQRSIRMFDLAGPPRAQALAAIPLVK